ncbi:MAG: gamma carbonic anhydrase family protein [Myxococcota bacterium]|jgi:carbonic anhydrase/acetyltransferase-like protein (isoleucine patch superfamily)|nr:gamma carbonic anhydrase family protein [Myxococcota bacterium]
MIESYEGTWPEVDETAFVHPSAVLIGDVKIGAHASIWPNVTMRGDVGLLSVGAFSNIQDNTVVHCTGGLSTTEVGEKVTVGHAVILHGAKIGNSCLIGMGALLLDNVEIGEYCLIGAGTLLTQRTKIPAGSMVLGRPGRVVRALSDEERQWIDHSWAHYVEMAKNHQRR